MSLRLSTVILPYRRWHEGGRATWQRAEELGFHAAYTYDHLSWRTFRDRPWFGAVPTLTAAAAITDTIRLGTLVTSPNFRHPVTLAKELISLDDISRGRTTLGIGAGAAGFDATALGQKPWSPRERADRLEDFVQLLDRLLLEDTAAGTSYDGTFYAAEQARNIPGCVQRPRLPFAVAANGPRGMALTARYGQEWVTMGDPAVGETGTPEQSRSALRGQLAKVDTACVAAGRDPAELGKILLTGFTPEGTTPVESAAAFVDFAGRYQELGFTEIVFHWPVPGSVFDGDEAVFERVVTEGLAQLH